MTDFLIQANLWLKALHIIAVMFWMAGLYYLPRLYAYHAESYENNQPALAPQFEIMEVKLLRYIINPAMVAAWALGLALLFTPPLLAQASLWLWIKGLCLLVLLAYHICLARWRRQFLTGASPKSGRFFRLINEIPPILTIIIVIMAVVKPF